MGGISSRFQELKRDVDVCLETWSGVIRESLGSRAIYAFAKGSAVKNWDTFMDYVPLVSDVDIHLKIADDAEFFPGEGAFEWAMGLSSRYEDGFREANPDNLHVPRTQLVILNEIQKQDDYVPPMPREVRTMFGEPSVRQPQPPEVIRRIDLERLREDGKMLGDLHRSVLDRTGLDLWVTIRQHLCWRVSPSPYRMLSQIFPDPLEVWSWNRSKVYSELLRRAFGEIANPYMSYYRSGWELFDSGMTSYPALREMVGLGYRVVLASLEAAEEMQ